MVHRLLSLSVLLISLTACGSSGGGTSNQNPVITSVTAEPASVAPGASSIITVVASDPNDDSLTYTYSASNGTTSGNGATATFLAGSAAGTATVTVTVNDTRGGTASSSTNITIVQLPPEIRVTALEVPSATPGLNCLTFAAIPQEDVEFISVEIINPRSDSIKYNLGRTLVVKGQAIDLQNSTECYTKFSGPFQFTFTGVRPGGSSFTSEATYNQP